MSLKRDKIAKVLLSLVLALALICQFAAPAMAWVSTNMDEPTWNPGVASTLSRYLAGYDYYIGSNPGVGTFGTATWGHVINSPVYIYFNPYVTYGGADDYSPYSYGSYTVTTTSYYCDGSTTGTTNTYTITGAAPASSPVYYGQQNITLSDTDSSGSPLSYFQIDINLSNATMEFYQGSRGSS